MKKKNLIKLASTTSHTTSSYSTSIVKICSLEKWKRLMWENFISFHPFFSLLFFLSASMTCRVFHLLTKKKEQYYWLFNTKLVDTCWRKNRRFYLSIITFLFLLLPFTISSSSSSSHFFVIVQFDRIPKLEWNGMGNVNNFPTSFFCVTFIQGKIFIRFSFFFLFWGWIFMIQFSIFFC